ncbi:methyltransferase domain-containing protein [Xanthobacter sp. KR7-225]|uniref:class I SAM-dependent methyltransferase n=1 Tax=Xanthobacter sp. KR7-225 TaxID=3156613 RepID=UPI0032B60102
MTEAAIFLPLAEAYDRWARVYDLQDNPMVFGASRIVERLAKTVRGQAVVELGCGTGRHLVLLKQNGADPLVGCDLSAGMLAQARARDLSLVLFQQDMAQPLPLADFSADLVLFSLVLEHMADMTGPLREAGRLLRPGGRIVVIEIHPFLSLSNVAAHFRDGGTIVEMPTFAHPFSDHLNAAAAAGLRIAQAREWHPRDFDGPVPDKLFKRGPDCPLLVEFELRPMTSDRQP